MSNSASAEAGPSRRTPIRSLRQPALLKIATRNDAGGLEPPSHSDAVALRMAMERKVQWRRKGERWMDRICEGTVGKEEFKRGVKYLEHHQYLESLHERHLNNLCSYPLCPNPPRATYTSKPKWKITKSRAEVIQKEGNEEDGFCRKMCKIQSGYVGDQMKEGAGLRGPKWELELLEEIKPDLGDTAKNATSPAEGSGGEQTKKQSQNRMVRISSNGGELPTPPIIPTNTSITKSGLPLQSIQASRSDHTGLSGTSTTSQPKPTPSIKRPPPKTAPPAPTHPQQPQSKLDDLLASLTIIERPTLPPAIPNSPAPVKPALQIPTTVSSARASSSLIATPVKLATTLITASRLTGPVPQLAEDSDSDSELSDWEVEMDGFGGLGDEEKRLFEEMREAREMVDGTV